MVKYWWPFAGSPWICHSKTGQGDPALYRHYGSPHANQRSLFNRLSRPSSPYCQLSARSIPRGPVLFLHLLPVSSDLLNLVPTSHQDWLTSTADLFTSSTLSPCILDASNILQNPPAVFNRLFRSLYMFARHNTGHFESSLIVFPILSHSLTCGPRARNTPLPCS